MVQYKLQFTTMKITWILICVTTLTVMTSLPSVTSYAPGLEDVNEIISVVRIGVSLVEYIYKVFSGILKDSGGSEVFYTATSRLPETSFRMLCLMMICGKVMSDDQTSSPAFRSLSKMTLKSVKIQEILQQY